MVARQESFGSNDTVLITSRPKSPQHHTILVDNDEWDDAKSQQGWTTPVSVDLPRFSSPEKSAFRVVFTARKRKSSFFSVICWTLAAFGAFTYYYLSNTLQTLQREADEAMVLRNRMKIEFRSTEKDVRMLARDLKFATKKYEETPISQQHQGLEQATKSLNRLESLSKKLSDHITTLQESVQKHSYDMTTQKYGPGPHKVVFSLRFPSGDVKSFTAEMAPLAEMPHSVQTFLDMASNGLWDGCSFVMNAKHVIKTAPLPYDGSSQTAAGLTQAFRDAGLTGSSFNEYSESNPHEKYTLGLSLQGGSPSFYVNTDDNTSLHDKDSSFAKVTSGFETIQSLLGYPTKNGIWLQDRIGIVSARVHA